MKTSKQRTGWFEYSPTTFYRRAPIKCRPGEHADGIVCRRKRCDPRGLSQKLTVVDPLFPHPLVKVLLSTWASSFSSSFSTLLLCLGICASGP